MNKILSIACITVINFALMQVATATVLTFDIDGATNGSLMPQNYGDSVTVSTMGGFSYGSAGGFTPNVNVTYEGDSGNDLNFWSTGYNDLFNVVENEPDSHNGYSITFVADTGYQVSLASLDMGNWGGAISVPELSITDGNGLELFSESNIPLVANGVQSHTSFDFGSLLANTLILHIDTTGLGGNSDNVGLDNIQFSQVATVPVPAAFWLFGSAIAGLISVTRASKRSE